MIVLFVVSGLLLALGSTGNASAKTTLQISPASGSPGTMVHIIGYGFGGDPVQVGMFMCCDLDSLPRNSEELFLNPLPEKDFALLATVTPKDGAISVDVTLSPEQIAEHGYGKQVYIVAEEPARGQTFVASQTFTFTTAALASAGTGGPEASDLPIRSLCASLAVAGALLFATGWRRSRAR